MTPLEETLQMAMQDFGLRELPPEWNPNGGNTLVDGIALVVKATGNEYCKVANKDGKVSIVRDYGICASILRIEKIYAVNTMTKFDVPTFKNDAEILHYLSKSVYDRAEIEALLNTENKNESQIIADRAEINNRIQKIAIEYTKRKNEEKRRVNRIREFADVAKAEKTQKRGARKKKE